MRMTMRRVLAVMALGGAVTSAAACRKQTKARLTPQAFELTNGLQVELVAGPCGDGATVAVLYEVGTDHDPAGASGLAHVVERAVAQRERPVEVGADHAVTAVVVRGDQVGGEIEGVAARMTTLGLTAAELERGKAEVIAELTQRRGGDAALTALSFAAESVQPTRGNGWRGGVAAEVAAIDLAAAEGFGRAHWKPINARLVVIGRFDATKVRQQIEAAFAGVPPGAPPVLRAAPETTVTGTLVMGNAPAAVAIAVPAPALTDPLYPAFLILAARLAPSAYDPLAQPETLFVTGPVTAGEPAEAAATRLRDETAALLARPLAPAEVAAARTRFAGLLGVDALEPAACQRDPRGFAIARARRAHLTIDGERLTAALAATTQAQLDEAAALFSPKRTAAVIAGGAIQ